MTIYDQFKEMLKSKYKINNIITAQQIKDELINNYGINPGSIIPTDYCYNRYNNGIAFNKHIFEYLFDRGTFRYLGENYPYSGKILHKLKNNYKEIIAGEWNDGVKVMYDKYI